MVLIHIYSKSMFSADVNDGFCVIIYDHSSQQKIKMTNKPLVQYNQFINTINFYP